MERADIARVARSWLKTPYHHQAATKGAGCDCLGLVRGVWRELYGSDAEIPPAYSPYWGDYGKEELMLAAAQRHLVPAGPEPDVGDVVLFRVKPNAVAKHCGIVVGRDRMVHAYSGVGVVETGLGDFWNSRLVGVFSFPGL